MNKYALLAIFWFIIGIYALLFRESTNDIPPFPHFDKVSHFALFFIQIWLSANAFIRSKKGIPYFGLIILPYSMLSPANGLRQPSPQPEKVLGLMG